MKVTADATLFGAYVARLGLALPPAAQVLDVGTGTGLLALMFAQLNPGRQIHAVELEPEAAQQAAENVAASPWAGQITVLVQSVQKLAETSPGAAYDLIISNPPFFGQSLPAPEASRRLARHSQAGLPPSELRAALAHLLKPTGQAWLLLPAQEARQWETQLSGLWPHTRLWFGHREGLPPHRLILGLGLAPALVHEVIHATQTREGRPTTWAAGLTAPFYLAS